MRKANRILVLVFGGLALIALAMLTGCAKYDSGCDAPKAPVATTPVLPVPTVVDDTANVVAALVSAANATREAQGQTALTQGLSCRIFTFTGGTSFLTAGSQFSGIQWQQSFLLTSPFNQQNAPNSAGLNVIPQPLQSLYVNEYGIVCTGVIVATTDDYYSFQLQADDAAVLEIDGQVTVNDDGQHSVTTKTGVQFLSAGVHAFALGFAQNYGVEQLVLQSASGSNDLSVTSPELFFH